MFVLEGSEELRFLEALPVLEWPSLLSVLAGVLLAMEADFEPNASSKGFNSRFRLGANDFSNGFGSELRELSDLCMLAVSSDLYWWFCDMCFASFLLLL